MSQEQRDDKKHGAYSPLTEHEIQVLREEMLADDGFLPEGKERVARLCDMAVNALLYAQEIQRFRAMPSAVVALTDDEITRLIATAAQHLRTWATSTNKEPYRNTMEVALRLDALVAQLGSAPQSATVALEGIAAAREPGSPQGSSMNPAALAATEQAMDGWEKNGIDYDLLVHRVLDELQAMRRGTAITYPTTADDPLLELQRRVPPRATLLTRLEQLNAADRTMPEGK